MTSSTTLTTDATLSSNKTNLSELDHAPLDIGNRVMPSRYFLAPLAGYTHLAFRRALRELGGLGLATTDLVLSSHLISGHIRSLELIETCPEDTPLTIQIYSGKTTELVQAAHYLVDRGYQGIDINMGCPMAKINGQGGGARLMCDTDGACHAVSAIVNAVPVPVTVKMRLGWDENELTAPALAREFEQLGVAAVTIHGRTRQQGFHGVVNRRGITAVVEAVKKIPIIGNGDVRTVEEAYQMRKETGCVAVAIGRGAMLDPWVFRKINQAVHNQPITEPTPDEQFQFLDRHFSLMYEQREEYACILFRKFAAWYGAKLGIPEDLEDQLRNLKSPEHFYDVLGHIKARHGERQSQIPTAFLKVPNGPIDKW
jgi:nifR3 family TIM-barrel protein